MFNELIEKVAVTCPQCKTSIKISTPTNDDEFQKLQKKLDKFICPMCNADLAKIANEVTNAIHSYNNSVKYLTTVLNFNGSTIE